MTSHLVLVLVVLAAAVLRSGACPTMCTCSTPHRATVRCDAYSENITKHLDPATHDLTLVRLDQNQLQAVIDDLEEIKFPHLARLTVTRSVVPDLLINLTFATSSTLRTVNLSGNTITSLPDSFFNLTVLQTLDLSENAIDAITNEPFRTLAKLELLNLSANYLDSMEAGSFSGLATLKCLDLSNNNLTQLEEKVFAPLLSLQYLNLTKNRLRVLNEKCFIPLLKLQQLDVSWNRLVRVELGSLQLPSLARLLLTGNPQLGASREPVLLVGTGQRLQTVDASSTGLKQVPAALTHSIRTLRLAANSIKTVRCGDLDSYPLLQLLDFTSNGLELIEDDALGRLDSLSILYLTNNAMKEIPKSLSEKLKVLHLEYNKIEKILRKDLQGLAALEVLLLSDNNISAIEEEAFNQLNSLVTLDISRNPIKILEAGSLSGSMALQVLRLSDIAVDSPAKEVSFPLSSTEHLITLDLSGSPGLARQLLVDTAALAAARELQELDLSHTDLDYIRSDLLHFLPQLRIFRIEGNRINCTQLQWLAAWMRRQDEPEYKKVVCASPPELWGSLLIELQDVEIPLTTPQIFVNTRAERNKVDLKAMGNYGKVIDQVPFDFNNETEMRRNESTLKSSHQSDFTDRDFSKEEGSSGQERDNNKSNVSSPEIAAVNTNSSHEQHRWNASVSMFSADERRRRSGVLHPGMLILVGGVLGAAAVLAVLAARLRRRTAAVRLRQEEEEEVVEASSLPGVTELW